MCPEYQKNMQKLWALISAPPTLPHSKCIQIHSRWMLFNDWELNVWLECISFTLARTIRSTLSPEKQFHEVKMLVTTKTLPFFFPAHITEVEEKQTQWKRARQRDGSRRATDGQNIKKRCFHAFIKSTLPNAYSSFYDVCLLVPFCLNVHIEIT